ncbi:nucleotidyltransferase family protein [Pseudomonas sp. UBA6310]|uniref:nucleotidyltransferase family protein n=1 Tax=Pseudomonas sp. UBA6310 TaxID=1947327 RepID=UPI00257DA316|nr:nucleotidyltransferase family protein [Pseudomonas sp. UBA6310]
MMRGGVRALLLAAGVGSRYRAESDSDKLLAPSRAGDPYSTPVLLAALHTLQGVAEELVVVVRADNAALIERLRGQPCSLLVVETNGLGHSLAQAVRAHPAEQGWLVALGDMPYVRRDTLLAVAEAIRPQGLVAPVYQNQLGHPRGIGSAHREQLLALDGERGAQTLFQGDAVQRLALDDPAVLRDIDRPGDRLA